MTSPDRVVMAKASPIRDGNGNVIAGVVAFMDITEKQSLEQKDTGAKVALAREKDGGNS